MAENLKARLVCLHMGDNNLLEDIELLRGEIYTVGRKSNNNIPLNIKDISNKHAEFGYNDNGWNIIDCNSTNGVYVNGKKTSLQKLKNGDQIQLGSALFCYQEGTVSHPSFLSLAKIKYVTLGLIGAAFISAGIFWLYSYERIQPAPEDVFHEPDAGIVDETPSISREDLVLKKTSKLEVYYDAKNENVLIFDFPKLHQNGLMFNRMLAFVEGPGVSKNALLGDRELLRFIERRKLTFETFSFGNDFSLKDIVDFFNLANRTSAKLNKEELRLRNILLDHTFMLSGDNGNLMTTPVEKAVISITQLQPDDPSTDTNELIDVDIRRALLTHEMSH